MENKTNWTEVLFNHDSFRSGEDIFKKPGTPKSILSLGSAGKVWTLSNVKLGQTGVFGRNHFNALCIFCDTNCKTVFEALE